MQEQCKMSLAEKAGWMIFGAAFAAVIVIATKVILGTDVTAETAASEEALDSDNE